jgi:hypothetical protein
MRYARFLVTRPFPQVASAVVRAADAEAAALRRVWTLAVVVAGCAFSLIGISATPALASQPLSWAAPVAIDGGNTVPGGLLSISCTNPNLEPLLCVAGDSAGNIVTSTDPTAGWSPTVSVDHISIFGVSCPSSSLCVAVAADGKVMTSTEPTGGPSKWTSASVDPGQFLESVSCPSTTFCVAGDSSGNVLTSTEPTGGSTKWSKPVVVDGGSFGNFIGGISCLGSNCLVVGASGNVETNLTAGNPTTWSKPVSVDTNGFRSVSCDVNSGVCFADDSAGNIVRGQAAFLSTWSTASIDSGHSLLGLACAGTVLCVAGDDAGNVLTATEPDGGSWTATHVDGTNKLNAISCPSSLCVAVDSAGNALTGAPAGAPTVQTNTGTGSGTTTGTLRGVVNPRGSATTYSWEYATEAWFGLTGQYETHTAVSELAADSSDHVVFADIEGLQPGTTYHFRIKATNTVNTTYGSDRTFTTVAPAASAGASGPVSSGVGSLAPRGYVDTCDVDLPACRQAFAQEIVATQVWNASHILQQGGLVATINAQGPSLWGGLAGGNLISDNGSTLISDNGSTFIAAGAGNVISGGAGNIISGGAGNIISGGAGNIISGGAGNVISGGAGNVLRDPAASIAARESYFASASARKRKHPLKPVVLLTGGHTFDQAGTARVKLLLTPAGKRIVRRYLALVQRLRKAHKRVPKSHLELVFVVADRGGNGNGKPRAVSVARLITLKP